MNFENYENKSSTSDDKDTFIFSKSGGTCLKKDMPINRINCSSQEAESDFSSVVIKLEEPEISDSDTSSTEMDSKPILSTFNSSEQSGLIENIKPEPFEISSRVKQEFVCNQGMDIDDKSKDTEITFSDSTFISKEMKNAKDQSGFDASNENETIKCDPLATETYVKQENEVYVTPSFSAFSYDNSDTDDSSEYDRTESANAMESQLNCKNETSFRCDVCNKSFTRRESLENHMSTHTNERPYRCDICSKTYKQLNRLTNHKNRHAGKKPFQCDVCDKCFFVRGSLKIHKRSHYGEKAYRCDDCDKSFDRSCDLKNHKKTHIGKKPYQCDVCKTNFSRSSYLNNHKRIHTGEKPFQCDVCNKTFRQTSALNIHKRTHTGEKPYQCDICNKYFTQCSTLKIHKRIHSGEKPYQCDICNKSFGQSQQLRSHKRVHINEKPNPYDMCVSILGS